MAALGDASPTVEGLVALLGGTLAAGSHFTKAGTRVAANTSPEPFSNWALSLAEDAFVIGLSTLALKFPLIAAVVVVVGVVIILTFAAWIVRGHPPALAQDAPTRTCRAALLSAATSRRRLNVIDQGASGWPSIAAMPSSSSTFTFWKRSSGWANLISSAAIGLAVGHRDCRGGPGAGAPAAALGR